MTRARWLITALSFAATIGVSIYMVLGWSKQGASLTLPPIAHFLAILTVVVELTARSLKIQWSARAAGITLPFSVALRTSLGGDFAAAITPARSGAEPARFFILAESGLKSTSVLVVLYAELFLEVFSLAFVVFLIALIFPNAGAVLYTLISLVSVYAAVIIGLGTLALFLSRRAPTETPPPWAARLHLSGKRWRIIQTAFQKLRATVDSVERVHWGPAISSFFASVVHVAVRLTVLPALVLTSVANVPIAPLALWPLGFLYGAAVIPAPGGGGAVEMAFKSALGDSIPAHVFGAALLWWRFYTFYIYIILGAIAAGNTVMRAVRKTEEVEDDMIQPESAG